MSSASESHAARCVVRVTRPARPFGWLLNSISELEIEPERRLKGVHSRSEEPLLLRPPGGEREATQQHAGDERHGQRQELQRHDLVGQYIWSSQLVVDVGIPGFASDSAFKGSPSLPGTTVGGNQRFSVRTYVKIIAKWLTLYRLLPPEMLTGRLGWEGGHRMTMRRLKLPHIRYLDRFRPSLDPRARPEGREEAA